MSILQKVNKRGNIRKTSDSDLPYSAMQPVLNRYEAVSTAGQTIITLDFTVDQANIDAFLLYVDGKLLREGASNDFVFTNIQPDNTSYQVELTLPLLADLNIIAIKLGTKPESEFGTDNRFVQLYEYQSAAFDGFVDVEANEIAPTFTAGTPASGYFYTTIRNRKNLVDFSKDLMPKFGVTRIPSQQIYLVEDEFGPNGEVVYGLVGDKFNQVRFVGQFWTNVNDANGARPLSSDTASTAEYVEITFYGTGLNILIPAYDINNGAVYSVDGGSETTAFFGNFGTLGPYTSVLLGRNYSSNQIVPIVSNLSAGIHTIRIRKSNTGAGSELQIYALEILNNTITSSNVTVPEGVSYNSGKKLVQNTPESFAYNDVVTGTRGGKIIVYQNADGTIGKAFTPVNTNPRALSFTGSNILGSWIGDTANHDNEQIAKIYNVREFGAGRGDDFSTATSASNDTRVYTLDDNVTTLKCSNTIIHNEGIYSNSTSGTIAFTFVGTGLDIVCPNMSTVNTLYTVTVDGITIGTNQTGYVAGRRHQIVSGLPYGTHTVRFTATGGSTLYLVITNFIVYEPKDPAIPSGAIALTSYNVLANYVANTTGGADRLSLGVISKMNTRELIYVRGATTSPAGSIIWTVGGINATAHPSGYDIYSNRNNANFKFSFYGTGFNLRGSTDTNRSQYIETTVSNSASSIVDINAYSVGAYGGFTYSPVVEIPGPPGFPSTFYYNVLNERSAGNANGAGLNVSGLPLDYYTVTLRNRANDTNSYILVNSVDIITPVYSPITNKTAQIQNAQMIGSTSLKDERNFEVVPIESEKAKAYAVAVGISSNPTVSVSSFVPLVDMGCTVETEDSYLMITYAVTIFNGVNAGFSVMPYIDGVVVPTKEVRVIGPGANSKTDTLSNTVIVPVKKGSHRIQLYWRNINLSGTVQATDTLRTLIVKEL